MCGSFATQLKLELPWASVFFKSAIALRESHIIRSYCKKLYYDSQLKWQTQGSVTSEKKPFFSVGLAKIPAVV